MTTTRPARPLDSERQQWAADLFPYSLAIARRLIRRYPQVPADEIVSGATWGVAFAASKYDPDRGLTFKQFAGRVIGQRIANAIRSWLRRSTPPGSDDAAAVQVRDRRERNPAETVSDREQCEKVRAALPPRRWEILWRHVGEGEVLELIGGRLGVTRERTRQLEAGAKKQARQALAGGIGPVAHA